MASSQVMASSSSSSSSTMPLGSVEIRLLDAAGAIEAPRKSVDDVWREIVRRPQPQPQPQCKEEVMTLEDFLLKAGAVEEEEEPVSMPQVKLEPGTISRKPILQPLDKAALQRQRRMIKNRESAARSRERKQAYQLELESMALRLEEENQLLLQHKQHRTRAHYNQLIEKVIPIVEKRKPPRVLRRVRSMWW